MKSKKVSISVFQIFITIIVIGLIVTGVIVVKKYVKFDEIVTKQLGDFAGSGTSEDPYKIETIEDLVKLSNSVNSGKTYSNQYFELSNKLDFQSDESYESANGKYGDLNNDGTTEDIKTELTTGNGFPAIGSQEHPFEGIFNGNDKTIRNLYINISDIEDDTIFLGLFGNNNGQILNLKVTGNITVNENIENKKIYVGMVSAKNSGIIQACKTEGTITANINAETTQIEVAGITAENSGEIRDSANSINITSNQLKAGIATVNFVDEQIENSGDITNCSNNGEIQETSSSTYYTAGIVADNQGGTITSCNNNGKVVGKIAGGIGGNSTGYIVACQNIGEISNLAEDSNDDEYAGGITAILNTATIENCKNTGAISGTTNIGGIAGENLGTISQCRNEGTISKISDVICKTVNMGGIIGKNSPTAQLSNSKNYGNISSGTDTQVNMGGICGVLYNSSAIDSCENNGGLNGSGKTIVPNEDINEKCSSCVSNNGGSATMDEFGELNIGIIYGKYLEK